MEFYEFILVIRNTFTMMNNILSQLFGQPNNVMMVPIIFHWGAVQNHSPRIVAKPDTTKIFDR